MPNLQLRGAAAPLFLFAAANCATAPPSTKEWAAGAVCASADIRVMANFATARANACEIRGDRINVTILPETSPINPSPWYAFKIETDVPRDVRLTLRYPAFEHRYPPKLSNDGETWRRMEGPAIDAQKGDRKARFALSLQGTLIYVAAQELFTVADHREWIAKFAAAHEEVSTSVIGRSSKGAEIVTLQSTPDSAIGAIFLVGRQHPPEVSGAVAFKSFMAELFADTELSRDFRRRFAIIATPVLNPDGVDAGHWRTSAGLVDLNRDWGPFTQPETRLMRDALTRTDEAYGLSLFLDFHSTFKNVIYAQTDDVDTRPEKFAERWHDAMTANMPEFGMVREGGHNTGRPTSKAYVYENYGVAAITFEMHEEQDRAEIDVFARLAAREMMKIMLAESGY